MSIIEDYLRRSGQMASQLSLLDIGCSTGYLTRLYGGYFRTVTGIDIDAPAIDHARTYNASDSVVFEVRDSMATGFPDNTFDAITCTHIYEHVADARRLMAEIYRVLKPGGFCYFAAGNRLKLMEAHYRLPLLSVIPKRLAHRYVRWAGKADFYYETHLFLWELKDLVGNFQITDYTLHVIRDPVKFDATDVIRPGSVMQAGALAILHVFYWLCPTYLWLLRKPG